MAVLRRNCEKTVTGGELTPELQTRIYKLELTHGIPKSARRRG